MAQRLGCLLVIVLFAATAALAMTPSASHAVREAETSTSPSETLEPPRPSAAVIVDHFGSVPRPTRPRVDVPTAEPIATLRRDLVAAFLGDSYTSGWDGVGVGANGWPQIVGRSLDWRTHDFSVPGTGFVNPGWMGGPFDRRVDDVLAVDPDVVIVAGGHNDSRWATRRVASAARVVLERLQSGVPGATIVVIGPIWQTGRPPGWIVDLRDGLRVEAERVGAVFVDPIGDGWFSGSNQRFIGSDGIHPTTAGHRHIARLVLAELDRLP